MSCANPRRRPVGALLFWLSVGLLLPRPMAAAEPAATGLHAAILLRAMAYERGLSADPGPLRLAVIRSSPVDDAAAEDSVMVEAFTQLARTVKVANRPLALTVLEAASRADTLAALRALQPHVIYVPAHHAELLAQVAQAFTEARSIILCADPEDMPRGCMLAVEQSAGKSRVVVHLSLAQRLGLHFDGRLLQLARVVSD